MYTRGLLGGLFLKIMAKDEKFQNVPLKCQRCLKKKSDYDKYVRIINLQTI